MASNLKATLISAARKLGVFATAGVATWVVSPAALNLIPTKFDFIVGTVLAPLLWEANRYLGGKGQPTPAPTK